MKYIIYFSLIILGIVVFNVRPEAEIKFLSAFAVVIVLMIAWGEYSIRKIIHG